MPGICILAECDLGVHHGNVDILTLSTVLPFIECCQRGIDREKGCPNISYGKSYAYRRTAGFTGYAYGSPRCLGNHIESRFTGIRTGLPKPGN